MADLSIASSLFEYAPEIFARGLQAGCAVACDVAGARAQFEPLEPPRQAPGELLFQWVERASGLHAAIRVRREPRGAAIIQTTLSNPAAAASPPLTRLRPLLLEWPHGMAGRVRLRSLSGGVCSAVYPPEAYRVRTVECRYGGGPEAFRLESHPTGGSANRDLPFLLLSCDAAGLVLAMEWSGRWAIEAGWGWEYERLHLQAEIPVHQLVLAPGESLELPAVHLVFTDADGLAGCTNAIRKHIRDRIIPRRANTHVPAPITYDSWFGVQLDFDARFLRDQMQVAGEVGLESFTIDAGWAASSQPDGSDWGGGNYERIDSGKFPNGIVADAAHPAGELGLALGLWFDPEQAPPASDLGRKHPEWFLGDSHHLDLTIPAAAQYLEDLIAGWIERADLGWVKWDYNIVFDQFTIFDRHDPTGKYAFHYFKALYGIWDRLLARYPHVIIEQCAGGGRRLDLATLRRGHVQWISDFTWDSDICRAMQANLNLILPGCLCATALHTVKGAAEPGLSELDFVARMMGAVQFMGDLSVWPADLRRRARRLVELFKGYRHLLDQNYYQLTPPPAMPEDGQAVQFVSETGEEWLVFVFANRPAGAGPLRLRGLRPAATYRIEEPLSERPWGDVSGSELMEHGLRVDAAAPFTLLRGQA